MLDNGFVLTYGPGLRGPHRFCGVNETADAQCPNCKRPLLQLFVFDMNDRPLESLGHALSADRLPLHWCWTCDILRGPLTYELLDRGRRIRLLTYNHGRFQPDTPYPDYPIYFPGTDSGLEEIPAVVSGQVRNLNRREIRLSTVDGEAWARPRHQLGGEPFFSGGLPGRRVCQQCGAEMELLGAVADKCTDARGFASNEFVQLLFWVCPPCRILRGEQDLE